MEIYRRQAVTFLATLLFIAGVPAAWSFEIEGKVQVAPPFREAAKIAVDEKHAACGSEQVSQALVVSEDGGLKNAVVSLGGDLVAETEPVAGVPLLDQRDCHFVPHVLIVTKNLPFQVGNGDPMAHDVRAFDGSKMLFRFEMEPSDRPVVKKFDRAGRFVIRCGLHPWMHAYVISTPHSYFAVSGEDGTFHLSNVPAGNHTVRIWHETLGEAEVAVALSRDIREFSYTFPGRSE